MITSKQEYEANLANISQPYPSNLLTRIPADEPIYFIDLNARTIEAPPHLSVTSDEQAEIIYFKINRYYDLQDLYNTTCVIMFTTPDKKTYVYNIPLVDPDSFKNEQCLLIPWLIESPVTKMAGTVRFAFRFFILDPETLEYTYILNTQPAQTKILDTLSPTYVEVEVDSASYDNKLYYIKKDGKYIHGSSVFDANETYYMIITEASINDASKLDAIYQQLQEMQRGELRWVEV